MRRAWLLWTMFGLCLAVGLSAMVWISLTIVRLERAEADSRRQAQLEENVRLALWRMDSMLSLLIAQETARPYFAYIAFAPAQRAYTNMFSELKYGEVLLPSPLLSQQSPLIHLHFQFHPDGTLSSPQVPTGNMRDLAGRHTTRERIQTAAKKLKEFEELVKRERLLAALPVEPADAGAASATQTLNTADTLAQVRTQEQSQAPAQAQGEPQQQARKSMSEFQARGMNTMQTTNSELLANRPGQTIGAASRVREGVMRPLWIDGALVLARGVWINGEHYIQGCWLDWAAIRTALVGTSKDLLPAAALEPVVSEDQQRQPRRLAALPVSLIPGPPAGAMSRGQWPVHVMLFLAWGCVVVAMGAVGALLWGAISLSQRRGAFVSAVTHELRTPLTTVSMYAEMLEEGMVSSEEKRRRYLGTLRAEADRLGHLVENVLAYSRIERGSVNGRIQTIGLWQLIDGLKDRLAGRSEQAKMELCVDLGQDIGALAVRADASAVEQILFNLVDNAGKYASAATDRRVHVEVGRNGSCVTIRVRDHGPGITREDSRRLFRPFSKSARDAANSAPGVGLGLALSRRLAREMGGNLRLEGCGEGGACFVLSLPVAEEQNRGDKLPGR